MIAIGVFVCLLFFFGLISRRAERSSVTAPMVFTAGGLVLAVAFPGLVRIDVRAPWVGWFSEIALGAGTYWVSVFNDTAADPDDNWFWARHVFPGNDARSLDLGATWLHEFSDSELAFQLWYPIPEPAALGFLTLGAVAMIRRRRV